MMTKKVTLLFSFLLVFNSCQNENSNSLNNKEYILPICNRDSLLKWSSKIVEERKQDFALANNTTVESAVEDSFISVVWHYDITNTTSLKDEYVQYCVDLISKKMDFPESFNLSFDYILNASCPIDTGLPIEVNSEIKNLCLFDNATQTRYDFDVVRGRVDSAVKYFINGSNKVTDTIYITY